MSQITRISVFVLVFGMFIQSSFPATLNVIDIYRKEVFNIAVLKNRKPVMVFYTKSSCESCEGVYQRLVEMAKENSKAIYVAKVDFDKVPHLKQEFGIVRIPTTRAFVNGQMTKEIGGPAWPTIKSTFDKLVKENQK